MAAPRIRKLTAPFVTTHGALGSVALQEDNGPLLPWDVIRAKVAELLRFLASALPALATWLREWARAAFAVALPSVGVVALVLVCCCCCGYYAAGGRRRRRGPDGEEAGGCDRPVVRYGGDGCGGGYKGGIFSMHPNKPIVC